MKVIKIESTDPKENRGNNSWLFVQTDKEQSVDYGYIGSTKHTYVSRGAGFVTVDISHSINACDYNLHNPKIWDHLQRVTEDSKLRVIWKNIDDDSEYVTLSDHMDMYEGIKDEEEEEEDAQKRN